MPRSGTSKRSAQRRPSVLWVAGFAGLLIAIAVSGLSLVDKAHAMRGLYGALGQVQKEQDALLEENSRLLLERSALTSMQNIEAVAESELDMRFPERIGQVLQ